MPIPGLTVEARRGVDRVVIHFDPGDHEAGFALLRQVLPVLRKLDGRTREAAARRRDHGKPGSNHLGR